MKFAIYSKYGCPYCTKVSQILDYLSSSKGHSVVELSLNTHFTKDEFYEKFGEGSTFPQVVLNENQHLGGCSNTIKYLQDQKIIQ